MVHQFCFIRIKRYVIVQINARQTKSAKLSRAAERRLNTISIVVEIEKFDIFYSQ